MTVDDLFAHAIIEQIRKQRGEDAGWLSEHQDGVYRPIGEKNQSVFVRHGKDKEHEKVL